MPTARGRYVILILMIISMFNLMDRQIMSILLVPIQKELHASDTQMGLITGLAFSLFYVTASFPLARWADVGNRRNLIVGAVAVWSAATMLCGLANSYLQLLFTRVAVAGGEAAAQPAALSMITDITPLERRGSAIGLYFFGSALGIALGYFLAGLINVHFGWRAAFLAFGAPGLLVALVVWASVPEPYRAPYKSQVGHTETAPPFMVVLKYIVSLRTYRRLMLALALQAMFTYSWMVWAPTFMIRVHALTTAYVGAWLGLTFGVSACLGSLLSGVVVDRLVRRYGVPWYARLCAIVLVGAVPFALAFLFAGSSKLALAAFFPFMALLSCATPPTYSLWMTLAPPRMRGVTAAICTAVSMLAGLGIGPVLIGALNDRLAPIFHERAIRYSFVASLALALGSAVCHWWASKSAAEDSMIAQAGPTP